MLKKIFVMVVLTTVFASFGLVTAEEISTREAEKCASEYADEGEYAEDSSVKVYYGDNPYRIVCFYKEATDKYKGAIIIDGLSGEVVTDDSLARDIFEAKLRKTQGYDFDPEGLTMSNTAILELRSFAATLRMLHTIREESLKELKEEIGWQSSSKLLRLNDDLTEKEKELADEYDVLADIGEEVYELQRSVVEKLEIEGMKKFIGKNDEFVAYISETSVNSLREYQDIYIAYIDQCISEMPEEYKDSLEAAKQEEIAAENAMIRELEDAKQAWEKEKEWVEEGTEWFYGVNWEVGTMKERLAEKTTPTPLSTPTPTPTSTAILTPTPTPTISPTPPGFEGMFAIVGLLAVAYLLRRRK